MTDSRFEQLVNLYLDKEISPEGFAALKKELASSAERRATFQQYRSLRAAESQIIRDSYVPDPADDIIPEPSRSQKLFAYLTQIGGMAAAVALSVGAFIYVTRSDSLQLDTIARDVSQLRDKLDARQIVVVMESAPSREQLIQRLMSLKNSNPHAVVATRIGEQQAWVVTPVMKYEVVSQNNPFAVLEAGQPASIEEMAMRMSCLRQMAELPGTSATITLPAEEQMMDYPPLMASSEGY
ncbi:hypothetical protein H5P28_03225 [Ruficoccus amylovorans]|uniref:Uncharacterized protein n=1 Tax=Ruficoccus amylovorans TaxID=1804625 RepID=A0A842HAC5_9BACT|nr:hypothetical protein [Ruficoccus amylovorans]MBC2593265.1 hypothetical protein [Ruficoccus amylovorans]